MGQYNMLKGKGKKEVSLLLIVAYLSF